MANVDLLLQYLREYRDVLRNQVQRMRQEYTETENRWGSFRSVYDGHAADQFSMGWMKTVRNFNEYIDVSERILAILDTKIDELEKLARSDL